MTYPQYVMKKTCHNPDIVSDNKAKGTLLWCVSMIASLGWVSGLNRQ